MEWWKGVRQQGKVWSGGSVVGSRGGGGVVEGWEAAVEGVEWWKGVRQQGRGWSGGSVVGSRGGVEWWECGRQQGEGGVVGGW